MNYLKFHLGKIFRDCTQYYHDNRNYGNAQDICVTSQNLVVDRDDLGPGGIEFKVWAANGGVIVRTHKYDEKQERHKNNMYVIPEGENLQDSISKIVTMEYLTR